MNIGILGTGAVGVNLGRLFLDAGHSVRFGSRNPQERGARVPAGAMAVSYAEAVALAEIVVVALPWRDGAGNLALEILRASGSFEGKIVVDATNPLNPDWSPVLLGQENSAGEEIARLLPGARVIKAFNTVFADILTREKLQRGERKAALFLCGEDTAAKSAVGALGETIGFDPVDTGGLQNSRYLEAMARLNIQIAVTMEGGTDAAFLYDRG